MSDPSSLEDEHDHGKLHISSFLLFQSLGRLYLNLWLAFSL